MLIYMPSSKTTKKKITKKKTTKKPIKKKVTKKKVPKKVTQSYLDKLIREVTEEELGLGDVDTLIDVVAHWGPKAYDFTSDLISRYF